MKQIIISSALVLASLTQLNAQSITRSVIGSSGQSVNNNGLRLRYSVGEAITATTGTASLKIKQGFQQGIAANTPLPISGLDFFAKRIQSSVVELQWKTMTEENNKGFYIERKLENEHDFRSIHFQPSLGINGRSEKELHYSLTDKNSYSGNSYYRIKQEDVDGHTHLSLVRVVAGDMSQQIALQVWPIPANGQLNLRVLGSNDVDLRILNVNGATVKILKLQNQMQQSIDDLKPGTYFITVAGDKSLMQKVIIQ